MAMMVQGKISQEIKTKQKNLEKCRVLKKETKETEKTEKHGTTEK